MTPAAMLKRDGARPPSSGVRAKVHRPAMPITTAPGQNRMPRYGTSEKVRKASAVAAAELRVVRKSADGELRTADDDLRFCGVRFFRSGDFFAGCDADDLRR